MGAVYRHKWEYRFFTVRLATTQRGFFSTRTFDPTLLSASVRSPDLDALGAEGWEVAAFIPLPQIVEDGDDTIIGHFLAKRPV